MAKHHPQLRSIINSRSFLNAISILSSLVVGGALLWNVAFEGPSVRQLAKDREMLTRSQVGLPSEPITLQGADIQGDQRAQVALIIFSDFQCPYCGKLARDTLPAIEERLVRKGRILVAFRHFPLEVMHHSARKAAEAAECAGRQGKFWKMHDLLFRDQKHLDESTFRKSALDLGLNLTQFNACLDGQATDKVQQDIRLARALKITGTPTLFFGFIQPNQFVKVSRRFTGNIQIAQLEEVYKSFVTTNQSAER